MEERDVPPKRAPSDSIVLIEVAVAWSLEREKSSGLSKHLIPDHGFRSGTKWRTCARWRLIYDGGASEAPTTKSVLGDLGFLC